jgi:ubiquinol-cytochrome c reductase iron-sulfur subunit
VRPEDRLSRRNARASRFAAVTVVIGESMSAYTVQDHSAERPTRRDFLFIATGAAAAVAGVSVLWPLVDQMEPDAATIAAGAPLDVDLKPLQAGQQMIVKWRGHPIFVTRRTPEQLKTMQDSALVSQLSDPNSTVVQQPPYATNFHRSSNPEYGVLVGVCTHLGCIPNYEPGKGQVTADWEGGYFCPCHGSKYDLAGRVFRGVPAPYNLPVPPYRFTDPATLRVGENPDSSDASYDLSSIVQL